VNVFITGGCGFIGTNFALKMLGAGHHVTVFDSLVRPGSECNLATLESAARKASSFCFVRGDIAEQAAINAVVGHADVIVHLAAQVSVVGGVNDPRTDFRSNAIGTFNVLEGARRSQRNPIVLVASTNKVYGGLERLRHDEGETRWTLPERPYGISEDEPLQLVTPYACSKGAGDLYALDYARTFGVRTVVLRQSCIYGIHQQATEDQAWVAWLMKAALSNRQIRIFGDGKQVRDILHIDDLIDAYMRTIDAIDRVAGMVFNIGGGPKMTVSIWREFGDWLQEALGRSVSVCYASSRAGDQRVFVTDTRRAEAELGWHPRIGVRDGLQELLLWLKDEPPMGVAL
jgi:CDP-paratose 2-epimerase